MKIQYKLMSLAYNEHRQLISAEPKCLCQFELDENCPPSVGSTLGFEAAGIFQDQSVGKTGRVYFRVTDVVLPYCSVHKSNYSNMHSCAGKTCDNEGIWAVVTATRIY